jgi:uncharacterized protein (DUF1778 family)
MIAERRTEPITTRYTPAETAEVERAAHNAGQSVSEFVRSTALASARAGATTATRAPDWGRLIEVLGTSTDQAMP